VTQGEANPRSAGAAPSDGGRRSLAGRLFAPADIASLVYLRVAFGSLGLWEMWRYADAGWIRRYYIDPDFHFTFFGLSWVQPWPGDGMYWHFGALAVLSVCIIFGLCYRFAATLFCVGFAYVFLLEKAQYLNHLYLFNLVAFLMIFIPAHRELSVDAWLRTKLRTEVVPVWSLWLIRFQMGVCYFYAGVAKMNLDWLQGWPLRLWLPQERDFPVIGGFFDELWLQLFFSWGGLLLDLLVPFFLLWRRTRMVAFLFTVVFHLINARLFGIGIFPWLSIALTLMFFPADWPRRIFNWPRRGPAPDEASPMGPLRGGQKLTAAAIGVFVALQILIPLRHFLYPGNVSWTEEGHNFAWHQKLRDKRCEAEFNVSDPTTGESWGIRESVFLTFRQNEKMSLRPHMILEFAHFLARHYREKEGREVEVRVQTSCSLNGRAPQLFIDPEVNLAAEPRTLWPKPWIVPLTTP
jgi:hypothetical protein